MASVTTNTTMSATITINGISATAYQKIIDYINAVVSKEAPKDPAKKKEEPKPAQPAQPAIMPKTPSVCKGEDKYSTVAHYLNYEKVIRIFRDYDEHPEDFEVKYMTTKNWCALFPAFNGIPLHGPAHTLGNMAVKGLIDKKDEYNPTLQIIEHLYALPVPKTEPHKTEGPVNENVSAKPFLPLTDGEKLNHARLMNEYTISELSAKIGYPKDVIVHWEADKFSISSEAKQEIQKVLGNIFDGGAQT